MVAQHPAESWSPKTTRVYYVPHRHHNDERHVRALPFHPAPSAIPLLSRRAASGNNAFVVSQGCIAQIRLRAYTNIPQRYYRSTAQEAVADEV